MGAKVINRLPDEMDEDGTLVAVVECICGARWYEDGADGLGNSLIPDDTEGIRLDDWCEQHVCFDDATRRRGKQLIQDIMEIRAVVPSVSMKVERICRAASNVLQASLYGSQLVAHDLENFGRTCHALNEMLHVLDSVLVDETDDDGEEG
jgi:hypothetical protein